MTPRKFSMWASGFCFMGMLVQVRDGNASLVALQAILGFLSLMDGIQKD